MKRFVMSSIALIIFICSACQTHACWFVYHKPEFKGRVLVAGTDEPIVGAVVAALYWKDSLIGGPGGSIPEVIHVKETLTDAKGEFRLPSYTTITNPNSVESYVHFIIYKPGYGEFLGAQGPGALTYDSIEEFFSKEIGSTGELEAMVERRMEKIKVRCGIVELPVLKTKEERLKARPSTPADIRSKELPLLFKAINEERRNFGLGEVK